MFQFIKTLSAALVAASAVFFSNSPTFSRDPAVAKTADRIFVDKSERTMKLFRKGKWLKTYSISLGMIP